MTHPEVSTTVAPRARLSSVANSLAVIECLVEAGEAGVSEIARQVGLSVGTSHRLLATLVSCDWAEQDTVTKKYRPSRKVVFLAQQVRGRLSALEIAHEHLASLAAAVDETTNLAIISDTTVLYIDKVTSPTQPFGIEARVGSRLPIYCTALGKVLAAHLGENWMGSYVETLTRLRRKGTHPTPPTAASFRREVRLARIAGYALDQGEYLPDVFCVAAPIRGCAGDVVAAMSVSVPRSRFAARQDVIRAQLCDATKSLSELFLELGVGATADELAVSAAVG